MERQLINIKLISYKEEHEKYLRMFQQVASKMDRKGNVKISEIKKIFDMLRRDYDCLNDYEENKHFLEDIEIKLLDQYLDMYVDKDKWKFKY